MEQQSFSQTKRLAYAALGIALVFICTSFVNLRLPIAANGGLIHLGNVPLFIIAILYGRWLGALAGGIGMALFDVVGGWFLWAPFTLVIVGLMGYTVGAICEKNRTWKAYIPALAAACLIKVAGYYGAEGIIYGNWLAPMASIPGNLVQIGVASVIVLPVVVKLRKYGNKVRYM
ncbi:putative membrane protein [Propionispora sp. 2/2-37]|uniref:ECF transporter S component n=1 Tax=Propionispora sp. 2/2-37 TaxID=1677858 RepID=UPI0006BB630D|nr:ECF transporter S component [Propionispora sp. 2/2-37]CUH97057.1 putative membrane protein [Propionispora sp. 2/2-37]